ncbi:MAG: hypothetical protein IJ996_00035 [Clostridia bacterium]|nr:hypothetical protein [Clostridia bacterium]
MKKKVITLILSTALAFSLALLSGCSLDLSHKHYPNDYGYCKTCETDLCVIAEKGEDGVYDTGEMNLIPYNDLFVQFVLTEDSPVRIEISAESTVDLGTSRLYSNQSALISGTSGTTPLTYENSLSANATHYFRVQATGSGTVRVRITPLA